MEDLCYKTIVYNILYTIGHSNREIQEFLDILKNFRIEVLIDIRRFPRSKFVWFNKESLSKVLNENGIEYYHFEELGGYRKIGKDVKEVKIKHAFKSEGFRAYAEYILSNEKVKEILNKIINLSKNRKVCLMCSEKIPWRCHRKILSDYFLAKGFRVIHVIDRYKVIEHKLNKFARIEDGELRYL